MGQSGVDADIRAYKQPGDPACAIYEEATRLEGEKRRVNLSIAAKILFDHWGKVFRDPSNSEPMNVKEATEKLPRMFALHMQLKRCYSRLLKRTQKDTREHRKHDPNGRRLSALLPRNLEDALNLSKKQNANADLGHLVRLGKVIHYAASDGRVDRPQALSDNWPESIDRSRFWNSDGQAEIKRAEAFIRIWRQALVLAGLTLKDWTRFEGDILGGNERKLNEALDPGRFDQMLFDRKLLLLFGSRVNLFLLKTDAASLELLHGLIEGAASLRHAVFHFKGRWQLLNELAVLPTRFTAGNMEAARRALAGGCGRSDRSVESDAARRPCRELPGASSGGAGLRAIDRARAGRIALAPPFAAVGARRKRVGQGQDHQAAQARQSACTGRSGPALPVHGVETHLRAPIQVVAEGP